MKRTLSLLLVLILMLTAGSFAVAEELEPVVIKVLYSGDVERSSLDDEVGQMIWEALKVEIQFVPFNESQYEKAQMMLAAQNWGDIDIVNTAMNEITAQYISANALVNLDEYRELMPNFYENFSDLIPYWRNLDAANGGLFVWQTGPDQIQMTSPCLDIVVRTDALEAMGWPDLDTTDDYIAFLKEAMEMFPESNGMPTIGMSSFFGDAVGTLVSTYLPRHSSYSDVYKLTCMVDVDQDKLVSKIDHPYYYATAKFFNTLYREGILDPEAWTDGFNECQAKMDSGVALSIWFKNWGLEGANRNAIDRGQEDAQYIVMPVRLQLAKDEGRNTRYEIYTSYRADNTLGILRTSPNVERICQLVDFMSTHEMIIRCGWGVEGRDYTVDEEGKRMVTEEFAQTVSGEGGTEYRWQTGINVGYNNIFPLRTYGLDTDGQTTTYDRDGNYKMVIATERQKEAYAALGWENSVSGWTDNENFEFVPFDLSVLQAAVVLDAESEAGKIEVQINDYLEGNIPKLYCCETDEEFEAMYAEMCAKCDEMGEELLINTYNEQYAAMADRIEELKSR